MKLRIIVYPFVVLILGGICLSFSQGNGNNQTPSSRTTTQGAKAGVSDENNESQNRKNQGREEIAQADDTQYPNDYQNDRQPNGYVRMSDWDFKESWRYNRDDFYKGKTQAEVYREQHPYGPGGIGYDADENYARDERRRNQNRRAKKIAERKANNQNPQNQESYQQQEYNSSRGY